MERSKRKHREERRQENQGNGCDSKMRKVLDSGIQFEGVPKIQ